MQFLSRRLQHRRNVGYCIFVVLGTTTGEIPAEKMHSVILVVSHAAWVLKSVCKNIQDGKKIMCQSVSRDSFTISEPCAYSRRCVSTLKIHQNVDGDA